MPGNGERENIKKSNYHLKHPHSFLISGEILSLMQLESHIARTRKILFVSGFMSRSRG